MISRQDCCPDDVDDVRIADANLLFVPPNVEMIQLLDDVDGDATAADNLVFVPLILNEYEENGDDGEDNGDDDGFNQSPWQASP